MRQYFNNNTAHLTTTISTMTIRPITSAALSPSLSPKRKYFDADDLDSIVLKKPKVSCAEIVEETLNSPLYKNFGNGLSVCNNTKTRFANVDEVLQYLCCDESSTKTTETNCYDINEKTLCEDVLNEFIEDLHETKELPELSLSLWDLRDMLRQDLDLL